MNVSPPVLQWFISYLSDRTHRVKCGTQFSSWEGDIPQQSALGPLLFLIYVNSLPHQITEGLLLQYATTPPLFVVETPRGCC